MLFTKSKKSKRIQQLEKAKQILVVKGKMIKGGSRDKDIWS